MNRIKQDKTGCCADDMIENVCVIHRRLVHLLPDTSQICWTGLRFVVKIRKQKGKTMSTDIPADILAAIETKIASGIYPDQESVLRQAMAQLDEFDDDVAGLQASIDKWKAGDKGIPVDEAFDTVRRAMNGQ
jgi:Arc/MetJ-type ribon-helix-helix transcriptional regulator